MAFPKKILSILQTYRALLIICAIYLLFSFIFIDRPGLQYDETLFTNASLGNVDNTFIVAQWEIQHIKIPVMLMTYIGAIKAYIYMPILMLFSPSPLVVRAPTIVLGLITLIITYKLIFRLFGKQTALLAVLLLATDPSYIFSIRMDWGPVALMLFFKMGSLYLFYEYSRTSRLTLLALGAFFLGLGLYDKTNFIWYCFALPVAVLPIWQKKWNILVTVRNIAIFLSFFLLGCWPLVLYNISAHGQTFSGQMQPFENVLQSIQYKTQVLAGTLSGKDPYSFFNAGDQIGSFFLKNNAILGEHPFLKMLISTMDFRATFLPEAFAISILIICLLLYKRGISKMRAILFFCLMFVLILGQIYISYRATGPHHVIMLYPFPHIIIAYTVVSLISTGSTTKNRIYKYVGYASMYATILLIISQLVVTAKYLQAFIDVGGKGWWSDAIYSLSSYTQQNASPKYMLMDWGFNMQLLLLSHGDIKKEEIAWQLLDESKENQMVDDLYQKVLHEGDLIFVFHTPQYTMLSQPKRVFDLMLKKYHLKAETIKVFFQRDGTPVYILKRVSSADQP